MSAEICLAQNNSDIPAIDIRVNKLAADVGELKAKEKKSENEILRLNNLVSTQQAHIDSLEQKIGKNEQEIEIVHQASIDSINTTNKNMRDATSKLTSFVNSRYISAIALGVLILILVVFIYFAIRKKARKDSEHIDILAGNLSKLELAKKELDNSIISSDTKLLGLIEKQLEIMEKVGDEQKEVDHSLAIAMANELTRIQQNLNHMDSSIKGVSQLKSRAKAILTILNNKRYDIPDLLGEEYHEGDSMVATMELNEDMKIGTNRIKRVIKPQVSYAGKLIQSAEVIVEYNE